MKRPGERAVFELDSATKTLLLRAGTGWKAEAFGSARLSAEAETQAGYTLRSGEPVVVENIAKDQRFRASPLLQDHGVVSSVTVAVTANGEVFGVIGAYTTKPRKFNEDEVQFLLSVGTVLAMAVARRATEAQIEKLATFARLNPNPAMELKSDGTIGYSNEAAMLLARALGKDTPQEVLPGNIDAIVSTCLDGGPNKIALETQLENRSLSWSFHAMPSSKVVHAYVEDITERLNMQAQLRQSQKMESIGQLAAGVAHDFNNMLTIIQGHSGLLLARSGDRPELQDSAQAVYFASERAANLTRQLLMFSRKNVMQPRDLDLRELVTNLMKMLKRLLGETIILTFKAPEQLPLINGDGGMIEQVIMNLAVNARDAMSQGGTLSLHVSLVEVEEAFLASHPEARTGPFVCLKVTDTGCGMEPATQARIFEPFFTTKEVGKGTGLGLATVYGIVKQHQGWIQVHTYPGQGSTFSVFFPAQQAMAAGPTVEVPEEQTALGGSETILVVEDEPVVREMAHIILAEAGYRVLEAGNGKEALRLWKQHGSSIQLLVTDVVMPEGISGVQLAEQLLASKPGLRIIFASGYSMDDLDPRFVQEGHAAYLQKPYTHVTLTRAVREALDRKREAASAADAPSAPNK